jgi:hypothetical protein
MKLECQGFFVASGQGILSCGRIKFFSRRVNKFTPLARDQEVLDLGAVKILSSDFAEKCLWLDDLLRFKSFSGRPGKGIRTHAL